MGQPFLRQWHGTFLQAPQAVALVAVDVGPVDPVKERVVGFLLGSVDQVALVDHVIRHHRLRLGVVGAWSLLVRPGLGQHFVRTRALAYARRLTGRPSSPAERQDSSDIDPGAPRPVRRRDPVAVITALVVAPDARQAGVREALMAAFVERATAAGVAEAHLTTPVGPEGAGPFVEPLGWRRAGTHTTRDGLPVVTYRLPLDPPGAHLVPDGRGHTRAPQERTPSS
ncbi:GNAT family N-acetyltransferase [Jannaschia sp. R86511]|uniref:GNAT family N-acetyltransferase n=1 Tax=Jannaschia sp. R86511 TaxID=3093853 RepID=UPI0036D41FF5